MRKQFRAILLGVPGAFLAVGTFMAVWETPRNWIADQADSVVLAMGNPWVTVLVTLLIAAYLGAGATRFATRLNTQPLGRT